MADRLWPGGATAPDHAAAAIVYLYAARRRFEDLDVDYLDPLWPWPDHPWQPDNDPTRNLDLAARHIAAAVRLSRPAPTDGYIGPAGNPVMICGVTYPSLAAARDRTIVGPPGPAGGPPGPLYSLVDRALAGTIDHPRPLPDEGDPDDEG